MYWGQIALAAASAGGTVWLAFDRGYGVATCVAIGAISYICVRWAIAWAYRVRYWYNRGTQGIHYEGCPNCEARRYRTQGDWILRCHRCGWKPGWLGLRWLTRSVPSIQLRRTVVGPQLLVVVVAAVLVGSGLTTGVTMASLSAAVDGSAAVDEPAPDANGSGEPNLEGESWAGTVTPTPTPSEKDGLQQRVIVQAIQQRVNEVRASQGLGRVSLNERVTDRADDHSEWMVRNGFEHTKDLDSYPCNSGTAENIAYTYAYQDVRTENGGTVYYGGNETAIGRGLVRQWMNSAPHRENILRSGWTQHGVGIAVAETGDGTRVYATQAFC